jgi:hypothetical protein
VFLLLSSVLPFWGVRLDTILSHLLKVWGPCHQAFHEVTIFSLIVPIFTWVVSITLELTHTSIWCRQDAARKAFAGLVISLLVWLRHMVFLNHNYCWAWAGGFSGEASASVRMVVLFFHAYDSFLLYFNYVILAFREGWRSRGRLSSHHTLFHSLLPSLGISWFIRAPKVVGNSHRNWVGTSSMLELRGGLLHVVSEITKAWSVSSFIPLVSVRSRTVSVWNILFRNSAFTEGGFGSHTISSRISLVRNDSWSWGELSLLVKLAVDVALRPWLRLTVQGLIISAPQACVRTQGSRVRASQFLLLCLGQ